MRRLPLILTVALCAAALGGCGDASSSTTHSTSSQAAVHSAAALFAGAYVRFLDGAGSAAQLPDATAAVRSLARAGGQVPPAQRRGTLVMVSLTAAQGLPGQWYLRARDLAHTFYATITVGLRAEAPLVTGIQTPDFEQDLAPAGPPPPPSPAGLLPALHAAQLFLAGYLPWLYGEGSLGAIHAATPALLVYLKAHTPRVPLTMKHLRPRVAAIAVQRHGAAWQALPNITDGRETYELVLSLHFIQGRWLASAVGSPQ